MSDNTSEHSASGPSGIAPWRIDDTGFGEPTIDPNEAGKAISQQQPPGWMSGEIRLLLQGPFMNKPAANMSLSGTSLRNGMKVWVDIRSMRTLQAGNDTFRTYRVILADTREIRGVSLGTSMTFLDLQKSANVPTVRLSEYYGEFWIRLSKQHLSETSFKCFGSKLSDAGKLKLRAE
ncbi:hypothetical protein DL93DRAFT_2102343 [Clavulina sp. PMI_390]|nr:hypothetical protein DL93DRAFT_2102343 [Clavulina sp. PMI_390]